MKTSKKIDKNVIGKKHKKIIRNLIREKHRISRINLVKNQIFYLFHDNIYCL